MDTPRPRRLTCLEAARLLGVSPRTLETWRRNRVGPPYFNPRPGRPFYLESDLHLWLARSKALRTPHHPSPSPGSLFATDSPEEDSST